MQAEQCDSTARSFRWRGYSEYENHVELEFQDGDLVNCDILIAADGIRSSVRKQFTNSLTKGNYISPCSDPVWSGTFAYRGLLSHEAIEKQFPGHRAKTNPVIVSGESHRIFRVQSQLT